MLLAHNIKKRAGRHLRGTIEKLGNKHVQGAKRNLVLLGSRRSGSTLLMQMIAQEKRLKYIDQPFSPFGASRQQIEKLPRIADGLFTSANATERLQVFEYLNAIETGVLHVNEPWRFWSDEHDIKSDRLVFKTTIPGRWILC